MNCNYNEYVHVYWGLNKVKTPSIVRASMERDDCD